LQFIEMALNVVTILKLGSFWGPPKQRKYMKKIRTDRQSIRLFSLILLGFAIVAGGLSLLGRADAADSHGEAPAAGGPPPAMPVKVQIIEETATPTWTDYSGRLVAVDYVELRPQVSGTVKEIRFEDGQDVKRDDILYVIDPGPYEAAVAQANADLAAAKSQSEFASKQLERAKGLMETNAISKDLLDERTNSARVAKNAIDVAAAKVKNAKIRS
jgi:membrane fusion protein, multidrug efflux system